MFDADFRWPRMARNVRALECDSVWFQFLLSLARRKCGGRGENKRTTARKNTIRMRYPFGPLMLLQMRRKQIGSIVSHGRDESTTCRFQIQTWTAGTSTRVSCITCLMSIFISSHRRHGRPEFLGRSVVTGCLSAPLPLSASITLGRMRPPTDNL